MSALTTRDALTRALHRHTCGTDWDEWNQPCAWAGEDWDPENGPATCAYVGEVGLESAVFAWVATLADDEAVFDAVVAKMPSQIGSTRADRAREVFAALAAALTERGTQ